jgi:hypothetical protein
MSSYKKFYFLHIPKTGGRYVKTYILSQLRNKYDVIGLEERHSGWIDQIDEETYLFSIIREPVEFVCSLYAHVVSEKAGLLKLEVIESTMKESMRDHVTNIHLDKEYLFKWLDVNKWTYNMQSKHILNGSTPGKNIIDNIVQKYQFTNDIDKELLYARLKSINLLIRQNSLYDPEVIVKKIANDLDIEMAGEIQKDELTFHNMASSNLYNSLTEEEKDYIRNLFSIDLEIYNDHSIFSRLDNICSFCGKSSYTSGFDSSWKKYSFCVECIKSKEALIG